MSLAAHKGLRLPFPHIAMCHQCHITKWEALTLSGQTPSGPSGDAALATSFIEACGQTWQGGFAQKIPRRAIKAFSVPRRRYECRVRRVQVCICCHFHQEAQQCCNSTAQRPCLGFLCQAPPPHTAFFGVRALSCPRRIGASRESYF